MVSSGERSLFAARFDAGDCNLQTRVNIENVRGQVFLLQQLLRRVCIAHNKSLLTPAIDAGICAHRRSSATFRLFAELKEEIVEIIDGFRALKERLLIDFDGGRRRVYFCSKIFSTFQDLKAQNLRYETAEKMRALAASFADVLAGFDAEQASYKRRCDERVRHFLSIGERRRRFCRLSIEATVFSKLKYRRERARVVARQLIA